ncbi:MAG: tol-pal system protein YbgF [Candidatus Competibacteraceae bacterium]
MLKIVVLKSFIERRRFDVAGTAKALLAVAAFLLVGPATAAPPLPPPLVTSRPDNQAVMDLLNRIDRLEEEVRRLRGDLELYRHQNQNLVRRVQTLEKSGGSEAPAAEEPASEPATEPETIQLQPAPPIPPPTTATPPPLNLPPGAASQPPARVIPSAPSTAPTTQTPSSRQPLVAPLTPEEQSAYKAAIDTLREGRYEEATNQLQGFLARYPSSNLAGDAQYWLGESYYVLREFERARQSFLSLGIDHPDNKHLADAMLRLGYIYDDTGDKAKAREVLQKLMETYPDSRAAGLARQRLQTLR